MIKIGSYYNSNKYGKVVVLSKEENDYYKVKFLRTGTIKKFRSSQIKNGDIRDCYSKSVCGVACTGDIKTKGKYKPYYSVWHDMINRCYNPNNKQSETYKNVTVCDEWLIFKNFYDEVKEIEGFDEVLFEKGELVLDKDIKQRFLKHKIYSKNTCKWVSKRENNKIQDKQQKPFIAISPIGEIFKDYNITDFARKHSLERRSISSVLHGRIKTTRGWSFKYDSYENIV